MQNYQTLAYSVLYGEYRDFVVTPIFGAVDYAGAFAQRTDDPAYNEVGMLWYERGSIRGVLSGVWYKP